jgi:DNA-binding transcriptional LysR family regulator
LGNIEYIESMISPDISLADLEIFVEVCRLKSLKETARRLNSRTSSLSKIITRIERVTAAKLFTRSLKGMEMTPEGLQLYRSAKKIMAFVPEMNFAKMENAVSKRNLCSIGAISFLSSRMVAPSLGRMHEKQPHYRFRVVEFDHTQLRPFGLRGAFDVAVHIGPLEWTKSWHTIEIAEIRWGLYGRYGHPLGTHCSGAQALCYPFVVPTGWNEMEGFVSGLDNCPVTVSDRIAGNEAATAETASELIQCTDELSFIPEISMRKLSRARLVQEIIVQEWPTVKKMIYLSVRSDRIPKKMLDHLYSVFRQQLSEPAT